MTTTTLGPEARPRTRFDTDWLTHPYRSGIAGLEAPLGPLDDEEKGVWLEGLALKTCRAREVWSAGTMGAGDADDIFDTVSEKPPDGENTMNINYEIT